MRKAPTRSLKNMIKKPTIILCDRKSIRTKVVYKFPIARVITMRLLWGIARPGDEARMGWAGPPPSVCCNARLGSENIELEKN